jgi:hypothetical protein
MRTQIPHSEGGKEHTLTLLITEYVPVASSQSQDAKLDPG